MSTNLVDSEEPSSEDDCLVPEFPTSCDLDSNPFHALGLNCSDSASQAVEIFNETLESSDFAAWRILALFGNSVWIPREGNAALLLSTGQLGTPSAQSRFLMQSAGWADSPDGGNENPDRVDLPDPIRIQPGSNHGQGGTPFMNCDGIGDCSDSLQSVWDPVNRANDLLWFRFSTTVPLTRAIASNSPRIPNPSRGGLRAASIHDPLPT